MPIGRRHALLREATRTAHEELDRLAGDRGFFADAAGYADYLRRVGPLYAGLESALERSGVEEVLPDWPRRRKSGLIRSDLERLGRNGASGFAPSAQGLGETDGSGARFGVLYVLEGATLGGAFLCRRLAEAGVPEDALSLLASYGAERGRMWRAFLDAVESAPLSGKDEAAMTAAAVRTFAAFGRILDDPRRRSPFVLPERGGTRDAVSKGMGS